MGAGFDLFISLHSNAAGSSVRGTEIWNSVKSPVPAKLASSLCASLAGVFGHRNRGVKYRKLGWTDWYGVLRSNRATYGMLIEHGFHTNQRDCWTYVNRREELAKATADILADWYGLSGSVPQASASSTSSTSSTANKGHQRPARVWCLKSTRTGTLRRLIPQTSGPYHLPPRRWWLSMGRGSE